MAKGHARPANAIAQSVAEIRLLLRNQEAAATLEMIARTEAAATELTDFEAGQLSLAAAEGFFYTGDYTLGLRRAHQAAAKFKPTDAHDLYGQAKHCSGKLLLELGRIPEAIDSFNEAVFAFKRIDDLEGEYNSLNLMAKCAFIQSRFARAREYLQQALKVCEHLQDEERETTIRGNLGRVFMLLGDFTAAKDFLNDSAPTRTVEKTVNKCRRYHSTAYVHIQRREYEAATQLLEASRQIAQARSLSRDFSIYHEYAGELAFWQGDYDQAEQHYREAIRIGMKIAPEGDLISQSYRLLAELQVTRGEYTEAADSCDRACTVAEKISERLELGAVERTRGQIAVLKHNEPDARTHFKHAITILSDIGAKYELARAHLTAGEAEIFDTHYRLTNLIAARLLFDAIGVEYWQRRVADKISALVREPAGAPRHMSPGGARPNHDGTFIATSKQMRDILERLERVKNTDLTILLLGETGVGKDHLARYIHRISNRADKPFQPISAVNIPHDLWESELFGHRKGAFTGANDDKIGLLEQADGGTVYLNEVSEVPRRLQAKMLDFLETRTIQRLGETEKRTLDIRFIAASNRDLNEEINKKRFRDDLFFRLNQMPVLLPPLRERDGEIAELTRYFLTARGIDPYLVERFLASEVFAVMNQTTWPGNVRQLEYVIDRIAALSTNEKLPYLVTVAKEILAAEDLYHSAERDELVNALVANDWNQRETARVLAVSEATIRHRMKRLAIYRPNDNGR